MGWSQPAYLAEEPSVRWTLPGPRVPRSAFTLHEATRELSQLCAIRHGSGHVQQRASRLSGNPTRAQRL